MTGDLDQPLGNDVGVRLNGLYEDGDSFRHHVDLEALRDQSDARRAQAGPDTRIDLGYEYFHDRRTADRGVPADGRRAAQGL